MKRIVQISLLLVVAGVIGGAVFKMNRALSVKKEQAAKLQQRPDLSIVHFCRNPEPTPQTSKADLIILFNPDCDHCQYEAQQLQKHHQEFAQSNVYLITTEGIERAQEFSHKYGLDTLATMHVGTLSQQELQQAFGPTSVPHLFIYGPDGQLRKEYKGETKIDALINYLL